MTPLWTSDAIAVATGGTVSADFAATGVAFDSREIAGGELFVAMRGTETDGHRFVAAAMAQGAAGCVTERAVDAPHVRVADSFRALQDLGRAARARTHATVVGVTGSVGKTSVKEMLRRAFERIAPGRTHWSVKSYNNATGVPLSLARMPADTRFAVLEMGMNHAGEIRAHTQMARPDIALVTWVAGAHMAFFPDEAAIARAKAEIFEGVPAGGVGIYPDDNPHAAILRDKIAECGLRPLSFGFEDGADVRAINVTLESAGSEVWADVAGTPLHYRVGMAGRHVVHNSLAVLAAFHAAGGAPEEAAAALADLHGLPGRGGRFTVALPGGDATIIDESYNANPASMRAALAVLGHVPAKRRLAVLGSMLELGTRSAELHAGLADAIRAADVHPLALVGAEMEALALPDAVHLPDHRAATRWAEATLAAGDVLLVKGSNSIGLGKLVAALKGGRS